MRNYLHSSSYMKILEEVRVNEPGVTDPETGDNDYLFFKFLYQGIG